MPASNATIPDNLTPRVRTILSRAAEDAARRGHDYVGTEHLLLALIAVGDGVASSALEDFDVSDRVRARIEEIMRSESYSGGA